MNSTALQTAHISRETTPGGTPPSGAANKFLANTEFDFGGDGDASKIRRGGGRLFPNSAQSGRRWTTGSGKAPLSFTENNYVFNSACNRAVATGSTLAKTRVYSPALAAQDVIDTYYMEKGVVGAVRAARYVHFPGFGVLVDKDSADLTFPIMGQQLDPQTAFTTATPTEVPQSTISETEFELFYGDTFAELDSESNKLLTGFSYKFDYGNKNAPYFAINRSNKSYSGIGATVPKTGLELSTGLEVSGTDYAGPLTIAKKGAGTKLFWRLKTTGGIIEGSTLEKWQLDTCCIIEKEPTDEDIQNVLLGFKWPMFIAEHSPWGSAFMLTTVCGVADPL